MQPITGAHHKLRGDNVVKGGSCGADDAFE